MRESLSAGRRLEDIGSRKVLCREVASLGEGPCRRARLGLCVEGAVLTKRHDWLVGANRSSAAADRIYVAAADLVSTRGVEGFTVEALAEKIHCSPATVYRHAGGKAAILEGMIDRASQGVLESVRQAIDGLTGPDRVVTAIGVALEKIRAQPLGGLMMAAVGPDNDRKWVTASPLVADLAEEMIGHADSLAAQYLVRVTFALWCWPVPERESEYELIRRFIGPAFF
ncbi:helix-turn-helix domain-containing protein [Mycolicibacterium sp. 050232]|uniref:TetR/AcrR family transcriptional regulator n=1 Tax=Mycolicibacterium sp. 050232 TaxID=3113982 RepID=UPI002E2D1EF2|nr:helix-turn-helix domain-containing protein [Mycolicibacterium sp. 050232]MED5812093.1 helix-turn-helix domain-containing protein [Mycolicibacterium sp. 050232]